MLDRLSNPRAVPGCMSRLLPSRSRSRRIAGHDPGRGSRKDQDTDNNPTGSHPEAQPTSRLSVPYDWSGWQTRTSENRGRMKVRSYRYATNREGVTMVMRTPTSTTSWPFLGLALWPPAVDQGLPSWKSCSALSVRFRPTKTLRKSIMARRTRSEVPGYDTSISAYPSIVPRS